ncbi:MAG: alpha/beta hydrolase [Akkermansiaceae bacterium]
MAIFLLPGMGATHEMYPAPWQELPEVHLLNWPRDFKGTTLTDLAYSMIREHRIHSGDIIVGSSLGGMVGCEISKIIELRHLLLLGSATHPREIPGIYRHLSPLLKIIPLSALIRASAVIPGQLASMVSQSSAKFIRITTTAIFEWQGHRSAIPLYRIHGSQDWLIPHPEKVDLTLNGGHLIASTHARQCTDAIRALIKDVLLPGNASHSKVPFSEGNGRTLPTVGPD